MNKLKSTAEAYTQSRVTHAVVSVPSHFTRIQRQAVQDSGQIAGLNIIAIINSPTAAFLAYRFGDNLNEERHTAVFDMGGGTLSVSIILADKFFHEVLFTTGNINLGNANVTLWNHPKFSAFRYDKFFELMI
ncbi:UNVERIFIED_CONTAM: hypothetical protein GTU68_050450 [Idotea baltica]|nr:hypothetical protein [Idotea baltica]